MSEQTNDGEGGLQSHPAGTPVEMFYHWESTTPDAVYLRQGAGDGTWREWTWREFGDRVRRIASFIRSRELPASSNIVIWSSNSVDWFSVDFAIMLTGHVSVPLYAGQHPETVTHILRETDARLAFLGPCGQEDFVGEIVSGDIDLVAIHGCLVPCATSVDEIQKAFEPFDGYPVPARSDILTIVYSSGTTGMPKGVVHCHGTPALATPATAELLDMRVYEGGPDAERDRLFSYLPLAHMAERGLVEFTSLYTNGLVSISSGQTAFEPEIQSTQPTFFLAVPRLWTLFRSKIEAGLGEANVRDLSEAAKADIRQELGLSQARFIMTGSAPIPVELLDWYDRLGLVLREGYGMTEIFATGTTWPTDQTPVAGRVGIAGKPAQFRIAPSGEVEMRSLGMMQGYYKNPSKTAEVLTDGWYRTGDLGEVDADGQLTITGRLGDVFKTAKGKFCHPDQVERHFHEIEELEQLILIGRGLDEPVILANLTQSARALSQQSIAKSLYAHIQRINADLAPYERVAHVFLTGTVWSSENGFLTPTLKQKRSVIEAAYFAQLADLQGGDPVQWLDRKLVE